MSFPFIFSFKTSHLNVIVHKHISLTASNACRGSHIRWPLTLWSELIKLTEGGIANTKRLRKWTWSVRLDHNVSQISACKFTTAAAASVIPWPTFQMHRSSLYISKPCYLSKPRYPVLDGDFGKSSTATCGSFAPPSWFDRGFCWVSFVKHARRKLMFACSVCMREYIAF